MRDWKSKKLLEFSPITTKLPYTDISKGILVHQILCISVDLTLSWRRSLSYRNQPIDLLCKSMDWLLYDINLRHERVSRGWTSKTIKQVRQIEGSFTSLRISLETGIAGKVRNSNVRMVLNQEGSYDRHSRKKELLKRADLHARKAFSVCIF